MSRSCDPRSMMRPSSMTGSNQQTHSRKAVRNDEHHSSCKQRIHGLLNKLLAFCIKILVASSRMRMRAPARIALAIASLCLFAARESDSAFTNEGVIFFRKFYNEIVGICAPRRILNIQVGRIVPSISNIVAARIRRREIHLAGRQPENFDMTLV